MSACGTVEHGNGPCVHRVVRVSGTLVEFVTRCDGVIGFGGTSTVPRSLFDEDGVTFRRGLSLEVARFIPAKRASAPRAPTKRERAPRAPAFEMPEFEPFIPSFVETLGLSAWPCTESEIKRAFTALALRTHPDHGGSPERFMEAKRARDEALAELRECGR